MFLCGTHVALAQHSPCNMLCHQHLLEKVIWCIHVVLTKWNSKKLWEDRLFVARGQNQLSFRILEQRQYERQLVSLLVWWWWITLVCLGAIGPSSVSRVMKGLWYDLSQLLYSATVGVMGRYLYGGYQFHNPFRQELIVIWIKMAIKNLLYKTRHSTLC